jgi:hypothetical protein
MPRVALLASLWDALSAVAAVGALVLSIVVWLGQRGRDRRQVEVQERLAVIEEARRHDEVRSREEALHSALAADLRVTAFWLERPGNAGQSDKVVIEIENHGPSVARNIDVALLDSEDGRGTQGLGPAVEWLDQFGGYSGNSRKGYFQIPWELPTNRPLEALQPQATVTFPFWLRVRAYGNQGVLVVWEDGTGPRKSNQVVRFDWDPHGRTER